MSVASALAQRYALWRNLLCDDFGYEEDLPARPPRSVNELVFRAVRPECPPVEAVAIDIRETWVTGADPDGLGLDKDGCFLSTSGWHAQILAADGDEGADRLDVDRTKDPSRHVHHHPLGQPNKIRVPAIPFAHPDAWIQGVEELLADYYGY